VSKFQPRFFFFENSLGFVFFFFETRVVPHKTEGERGERKKSPSRQKRKSATRERRSRKTDTLIRFSRGVLSLFLIRIGSLWIFRQTEKKQKRSKEQEEDEEEVRFCVTPIL